MMIGVLGTFFHRQVRDPMDRSDVGSGIGVQVRW